jgi:hypothetical protein
LLDAPPGPRRMIFRWWFVFGIGGVGAAPIPHSKIQNVRVAFTASMGRTNISYNPPVPAVTIPLRVGAQDAGGLA